MIAEVRNYSLPIRGTFINKAELKGSDVDPVRWSDPLQFIAGDYDARVIQMDADTMTVYIQITAEPTYHDALEALLLSKYNSPAELRTVELTDQSRKKLLAFQDKVRIGVSKLQVDSEEFVSDVASRTI